MKSKKNTEEEVQYCSGMNDAKNYNNKTSDFVLFVLNGTREQTHPENKKKASNFPQTFLSQEKNFLSFKR